MTIHKSQGLTLPCALIDLGNRIFAPSKTYVALSRVSSLEGVHLINFDPKKILVNTASLEEYIRLGSKSGISRDERKNIRKANSKVVGSFKLTGERVWYISNTRKKSKATIEGTVLVTTNKRRKTNNPKANKRGKPEPMKTDLPKPK